MLNWIIMQCPLCGLGVRQNDDRKVHAVEFSRYTALVGHVAGGQGRHHIVALDVVGRADDVSQRTEPGTYVQARALQQHVRRGVRWFTADQAAARWTLFVFALGALGR